MMFQSHYMFSTKIQLLEMVFDSVPIKKRLTSVDFHIFLPHDVN